MSIIRFEKTPERDKKIARERAKNEDFMGALSILLSMDNPTHETFAEIADVYSDMGLLELSNEYWYKFINVAPKEKLSIAYEELAINFFYLENLWASGYYFHQKISVDGYISNEGLDQEIIDFFSGNDYKKHAYRIAYPRERADYTLELKRSKRALSVGAFEDGVTALTAIPLERRTEEISGDLAISYLMCDKLDLAEEVCRDSIKRHGENVTAYCNLSTVYDMKEDYENSEYYYQKALSMRTGDRAEWYKIATCAIARQDHLTIIDCLKKILEERPYETSMIFFYGQALANVGDYEGAYEQLKKAYNIDRNDKVVKYHFEYVKGLKDGEGDKDKLLPFKYLKELPDKQVKKNKKIIQDIIKAPEKISSALKKQSVKDAIEWSLAQGEFLHDSVFALVSSFTAYAKSTLKNALLKPEYKEETKRLILYVLTLKGVKEKLGLVVGNIYVSVKPKRLQCEKQNGGELYFNAYALALSKTVFFEIEGYEQLAKVTDKIYKKLGKVVTESEATNEEIGALILSYCDFKRISKENEILRFFSVTKEKLRRLRNLYEGVNND